MTRRTLTVLAAVLLAVTLPGCGKRETKLDELLAAVRRTQRAPHRFVYSDKRPENVFIQEPAQQFRVLGLVEDDFRFKARAEVDGQPAFDEVVVDDLLGIRFMDPSKLGQLLDRSKLGTVDIDTDIPQVNVVDALQAKRWVLDPEGAPPITANVRPEKELGADPILDSLTALSYVAQAARESAGVKKYSKDDLEPAYPASEDDFPRPAKGETRYDLVRPRLPSIATASGAPVAGGQSAFPGTKHFRKMAIYVKDGVIIKVREEIEVKGKFLGSVIKYVRKSVEQSKIQAAIDGFAEFLKETPVSQQGLGIIQFLSVGLQSFGQDPILVRNMTLDLLDFGQDIKVDLPTDGVVKGNLGILRTSSGSQAGQPIPTPGSDAGGSGGSTVTTSVGGIVVGDSGSGSTSDTTP